MSPPPETSDFLDDWFEKEILPHEAALTGYLRRVWGKNADIDDFRQEVYVRVYESASRGLPESPQAFLIATARHLIVDRVRRERIVAIDYTQDLDPRNVLVDEVTPERRLTARQELRCLAEAFDQLSADCRAVVWLRRVDEFSQREVAEKLSMQEGTVSSHLARGIKILTKVVLGNLSEMSKKDAAKEVDNEVGRK